MSTAVDEISLGTGSSSSTSTLPCRYHSTNAPILICHLHDILPHCVSFQNVQFHQIAVMSASCCRMGYITMLRALRPWLFYDTLFQLSAHKTRQNECLKVLHDMTNSVIRKRRKELMAERATQSTERNKEDQCGKF